MKGKLTITVEMDDAGACFCSVEMTGTLRPFDHGRLFSSLAWQAGDAVLQTSEAYKAAGNEGWAGAFLAGCVSDPGAPTVKQVASGIREVPGWRLPGGGTPE